MPTKNSTRPMKTMFLLFMMFFLSVFGATGSVIAGGSSDITLVQALAVVQLRGKQLKNKER